MRQQRASEVSDVLSLLADSLAKEKRLSSAQACALHFVRMAARLLYRPRVMTRSWHKDVHAFFKFVEIRTGDQVKQRHQETELTPTNCPSRRR